MSTRQLTGAPRLIEWARLLLFTDVAMIQQNNAGASTGHLYDMRMPSRPAPPDVRYADLAQTLLSRPGVHRDGTGFGSRALKTGGKIFAMLSSRGEFVVKLPQQRVAALIASGDGHRYDPGRGRLMKEWLAVDPSSPRDWQSLAEEALEFVRGIP
jgi:hypothetical protein